MKFIQNSIVISATLAFVYQQYKQYQQNKKLEEKINELENKIKVQKQETKNIENLYDKYNLFVKQTNNKINQHTKNIIKVNNDLYKKEKEIKQAIDAIKFYVVFKSDVNKYRIESHQNALKYDIKILEDYENKRKELYTKFINKVNDKKEFTKYYQRYPCMVTIKNGNIINNNFNSLNVQLKHIDPLYVKCDNEYKVILKKFFKNVIDTINYCNITLD